MCTLTVVTDIGGDFRIKIKVRFFLIHPVFQAAQSGATRSLDQVFACMHPPVLVLGTPPQLILLVEDDVLLTLWTHNQRHQTRKQPPLHLPVLPVAPARGPTGGGRARTCLMVRSVSSLAVKSYMATTLWRPRPSSPSGGGRGSFLIDRSTYRWSEGRNLVNGSHSSQLALAC